MNPRLFYEVFIILNITNNQWRCATCGLSYSDTLYLVLMRDRLDKEGLLFSKAKFFENPTNNLFIILTAGELL